MKKAILYIHGKGGNAQEVEQYRKNCPGFDLFGVDYDQYFPWIVQNEIQNAFDTLEKEYEYIVLLANSIGAYFAMHTLQGCKIQKALLISPVLDMEQLIQNMMQWAGVTEQELREREEIPTSFGETLSWKYLQYVKEHPIHWDIDTHILYAGKDNLTSRETVEAFAKQHCATITIMENGEHWFHTQEQMDFLNEWMKKSLK